MRWSPDSRTLYYRSGGRPEVIAATLEAEDGISVVERTPLTALPLGQTFLMDRHPDGRFLIATTSPEASADAGTTISRRIVITNFFEQLRARMGGE